MDPVVLDHGAKKGVELDLNYPKFEGRFDEARQDDGTFRDHWQYLFESFQTLGRSGLIDRQVKANRLLRDDGANYSRVADAKRVGPWGLDPIPLLIDSDSWSGVERGLSERSELFDLMLRDLYSERALLRSGIIPPEIILNHPAFLRSCQGQLPSDKQQLIIHAVDLARTPTGEFQVLSDRTQAPSGAGYALLNRTVMSRILPSMLRDSQVHRLAVFFQTLRRELATLTGETDPRIVILTPGAFSETYFEHGYLANYLGYSLVQGSDLVVRDGYVWMRSLEGLHRVDVILRRLDDIWCDPVELKGDSELGVPGLLEVIRAGNVKLANPLGSGVLESPAILRYIDKISEFYLGRKLELTSVKTWWLGDKDDLSYVIDNVDKLIIKPSARGPKTSSIYGPGLTQEKLAELKTRILATPDKYVAQVANQPSTAPSWQRNQLQSLPTILRTFTVADQGSFHVMAGGLTRTAFQSNQSIVSNQVGATSKDTWVLASEPQANISLLAQNQRSVIQQSQAASTDLPSRVVENIFWMGRYAERAEASARFIRTLILQLNAIPPIEDKVKHQVLCSLTALTGTAPGFYNRNEKFDDLSEIDRLITDRSQNGTLASNLQSMLNCSEEVREMLSSDTHRVLSDLRDQLYQLGDIGDDSHDPVLREEILDSLVLSLMALSGLTHESMLRSLDWRFLEMGRRIERALLTGNLLRSTLVTVLDDDAEEQLLETLMLSSETLNTYRRRYPKGAKISTALPIMMFDESNPRSLIYQINALEEHLQSLSTPTRTHTLTPPQRALLHAASELRLAHSAELSTIENHGSRQKLDDLLALVLVQMTHCADRISEAHFEQSRKPHQLIFANTGG